MIKAESRKQKFGNLICGLILAMALPAMAQTETNAPGSFFQTAVGYFSSFNTNLDSTFTGNHGAVWTGVDSLQGGDAPLANALGISYDVWRPASSPVRIAIESVTRNSGIAGTLVSEQVGASLSFVVHDAKLSLYADGGYDVGAVKVKTADRLYGEIGLRVQKALTEHTFAGVGLAAQVPENRQVFSVFAGFTF